jgi:hypothetical protein
MVSQRSRSDAVVIGLIALSFSVLVPASGLAKTPLLTPPPVCAGDCDGSGDVTVNEIITLVNMVLGTQTQLSACPYGLPPNFIWLDPPGDISWIIQAVNNALYGCAVLQLPPPTPTLGPSPTPTQCVLPFTRQEMCADGSQANGCLNGGGGSKCFDVAAPPDCCWTATMDNTVCTSTAQVTKGASACGNNTVCFSYGINSCVGHIGVVQVIVGNQFYHALQNYRPTPAPPPAPTEPYLGTPTPVPTLFGGCVMPFPQLEGTHLNAFLDPAGGTQCIDVVASPDCCWKPLFYDDPNCLSDDVILTVEADGGCGNGVVCFIYGTNPGARACASARVLSISFGDHDFISVQQTLPTPTPTVTELVVGCCDGIIRPGSPACEDDRLSHQAGDDTCSEILNGFGHPLGWSCNAQGYCEQRTPTVTPTWPTPTLPSG